MLDSQPIRLKSRDIKMRVRVLAHREALCTLAVKGLARIGTFVTVRKAASIRNGVNGPVLGDVRPGQVFQILDYEIDRSKSGERHYRVRFSPSREGYIYGGTDQDHAQWLTPLAQAPNIASAKVIPFVGATLEVVRRGGLLLLSQPIETASRIGVVPFGYQIQVEQLVMMGTENEIYLQVSYGGKTGYLYVGRTYPNVSTDQWVKVIR